MNGFAILFLFLLLDQSFSNAHTLSKIELNNRNDVYEVKEDQSSLSIKHPHDTKPTLRGITYYHIIEKPYDTTDYVDDLKKGEDTKTVMKEQHNHDLSDLYKHELNGKPKGVETNTQTDTSSTEELEDDDEQLTDDENEEQDLTLAEDDAFQLDAKAENTTIVKAKPIKGNIETKSENLEYRVKREIDYTNLPDAPSLPEFKLDILPDYIKTILMEEPENQLKPKRADILEEEIEKKVRNLEKAVKHPPATEYSGNKRKARTYGMSLAGDRGVVWNDLNAAHVSYNVGEPGSVTTTNLKPEEVHETTTTRPNEDTFNSTFSSVEEEHVDENLEENEDSEDVESESKIIEQFFHQIQKIFEAHINNSKNTENQENIPAKYESTEAPKEKTGNENKPSTHETDYENRKPSHNTSENTQYDEEKSNDRKDKVPFQAHSSKNTENQENIPAKYESTETPKENTGNEYKPSKHETDNENRKPSHNTSENNTRDEEEKSNDRKDKIKETTKHKNEESKQQQFVKELMKNKYFWQRLNDSAADYLEIIMKKVNASVKAEVAKQIKQYFEEQKDVIAKPGDNNIADHDTTVAENPVKCSNVTIKEEYITTTTETTILNSTEPNDPASNDIVIDQRLGTANDTEKKESAYKHRDKESNDKKENTPTKIVAQNIYGNSVGNGKVTNIFIFNISKIFDLENIKPISNGTNGEYVFGLDTKIPNEEIVDKAKIPDAHNSENKTPKPEITDDQNNDMESDEEKTNISGLGTAQPETDNVIDQSKENIVEETSKDRNEAINDQTTPKEPINLKSTSKPSTKNELAVSFSENAIEQTTSAVIDQSKDLKEEIPTEPEKTE